ncbi:MAG: hypothetical protein IJ955_08705 [Oscillospiraceae bacterium]|nr:hypothetical protein [Oscillospiraceae bacterium]
MDKMNFFNRHYITVDEAGRITGGFSDAFRQPSETDICINEQGGYQFRLFPDGAENPMLLERRHRIPLYRWDGSQVVRRTAEEIDADIAAIPVPESIPTEADDTAAMLVDHEFRLTLLELGVV